MSTFAKPLTPTKCKSNSKLFTPTKSKSMSNICKGVSSANVNYSTSSNVLEEINLLLYLETVKRQRDSEIILRQKVEEAYKIFKERRQKYLILVAKYAALVKLASTNKVLQLNDLIDLSTESAHTDAKYIKEKLSSDSASDYINTAELDKFKQMLHRIEKYKNVSIRSSELVELQNAADAIQNSIETVEILLAKSTTQCLYHCADTLNMSNYPKLEKDHRSYE